MSRWFRHYAGMMRDDKLVSAAIRSKQTVERVVWVWGAILESASEINDGGRFEIDAAEIAYFLRADEGDIRAILDGLADMQRLADGRVVNWSARQFESDRSAPRQAAYRERQRAKIGGSNDQQASRDGDVTSLSRHGDSPETETDTNTEKEKKDFRAVAPATRPDRDEPFEQFWKSYPKRDGANPKAPARKLFLAAVKAGTDPAVIVAGAMACALKDREKIGTPYIPQAVRWLRDRRWEDYGGSAPSSTGPPPGWKPGMPTSDELRAKYEREQSNGGQGNPNRLEQAAPVDEGGEGVCGGKSGVFRREEGDGRRGIDAGIQKLGSVLRQNGLGAMGLSPAQSDRGAESPMDGPMPMARVVHG